MSTNAVGLNSYKINYRFIPAHFVLFFWGAARKVYSSCGTQAPSCGILMTSIDTMAAPQAPKKEEEKSNFEANRSDFDHEKTTAEGWGGSQLEQRNFRQIFG
ncbi:Uncharacterized protein APZ42_022502 [Daphnia magna]|uniref:Uncharacterized protein n=1 Tax=Daphnia magna TaxID=35525 RepID=A0A164VIU8_9CRUS|nr:Uncharacterized protein APZ42_022502 [Daphnia magna]